MIRGTPWWLIGLCLALATIEPIVHAAIEYFPPEGAVHTGLHTPDSVFFLIAMRMFETDLYSPFATCQSARGDRGLAFYPLPFHWMYGLFGAIGSALRLSAFQYFSWINAAGFLAYSAAVYALYRVVAPQHATRAMTIFLLGGGLGGVLFLLTGAAGLHDTPGFDTNFERFARYQLFDGATLLPALQATRLYYTLPRAIGIAAIAVLILAIRRGSTRGMVLAALVLAVGTLANMNLGAMTFIAAMFFLFAGRESRGRTRWNTAAMLLIATAAPWAFSVWMIAQSPTYFDDARVNAAQALWFGPLVCAILFHALAAAPAIQQSMRSSPLPVRLLLGTGLGYLAAFALLYAGYQAYWGNWLAGGDYNAAVAVSDWALIGAAVGAICIVVRARRHPVAPVKREEDGKSDDANIGWIALWFMAFVCVGISAFGQGWFLRLTPTRFGWMLGPPLALLAAIGLAHWRATRPRFASGLYATLILCGLASVGVSTAYFMGPWFRQPGEGLFARVHCEYMTQADAAMLAEYDGGVLLAPARGGPFFGDVVAMRPRAKVVYGLGTYDFSDQMMTQLGPRVTRFFANSATNDERKALVDEYCAAWVFCPDTVPVDTETIAQLREAEWLSTVEQHGRGVLFAVRSSDMDVE